MKKNNRKGFTLIELLAVIVILAVIVLLMMPNVTSLINNATQNAFRTEVLSLGNYIQDAYADKLMTGGVTTSSDGNSLCMTLKQLKDEGFITKDLTGYKGYATIFVPASGAAYITVSVTNDKYMLDGALTKIQSNEIKVTTGNTVTDACPATIPKQPTP